MLSRRFLLPATLAFLALPAFAEEPATSTTPPTMGAVDASQMAIDALRGWWDAPRPESVTHAAWCATSFPERLRDARSAYAHVAAYMKEWQKGMPWFDEHCRYLSELEIAVRKLDDPNAFVCDPKAKGRPTILTAAYVASHSNPIEVWQEQEYLRIDDLCEPHDVAAERPALAIRDSEDAERVLPVLCWEKTSPSCDKFRDRAAKLEARRARSATTGSRAAR